MQARTKTSREDVRSLLLRYGVHMDHKLVSRQEWEARRDEQVCTCGHARWKHGGWLSESCHATLESQRICHCFGFRSKPYRPASRS